MADGRLKKIMKKKSTGIITTILAFGVTLSAIMVTSNVSLAKDSLPGVTNVRQNMLSVDTPYKILEIVPDVKYAEIGFLVDGAEPLQDSSGNIVDWQSYLAMHIEDMTQAERETYMNDLATINANYVGTSSADNKPLLYVSYKEVAEDTNGASMIVGSQANMHGYLSSDISGSVERWNAKFTLVPPTDYAYEELISNNITPYYIVDTATALVDENSFTAYPEDSYLYQLVNSATNEYSCSGTLSDLKEQYDTAPEDDKPDVSQYYVVSFRLIERGDYGNEAVIQTPSVYTASSIIYDEQNGPYKVEITAESEKGHSVVKPSKKIYYTGGFVSDNWMLQYVFDVEQEDCGLYHIEVDTKTAGEVSGLTSDELDEYDFIYVNSGNQKDSGFHYSYVDTTKDLSKEAVKLLFEKICNNKIPCIMDYTLIANASGDNTNSGIYALACMLMQDNYRSILSVDKTLDIKKITVGDPRAEVANWVGTIVNSNNYNYVNENVMVMNTASGNYLTTNFHTSPYDEATVSSAYSSVLEEIQMENLYRLSDQGAGYTPLDENIYKSTVVRYIINCAGAREIEAKKTVKVLEIQPGAVQYPDNSTNTGGTNELTPSVIRKWMDVDNSVQIDIVTMTTTEFIGKIEDINSTYDLVYIGADTYSLKANLDYQDNSMDGMIYTNVGDTKWIDARLSGQLDTDFYGNNPSSHKLYQKTEARYTGNDITADKFNALVEYLKGSYPIVVSNTLCQNAITPSSQTLDNSSYLYSFLKEHLKDVNVFRVSDIKNGDNADFKFYANRGKLDLGTAVVSGQETTITDGTAFVLPGVLKTQNDTTNGKVTYIAKENGKFYLQYKFTITNTGAVYADTRYKVMLYLDSNADGKFSKEYEEISDVTITEVKTGVAVKADELVIGTEYQMTKQVSDSYRGLLTWKVEVQQSNNEYIRNSVIGYSKLNDADKDATEIRVLHVYKDYGATLNLEQAIGNQKGTGNNQILRTLVWGGKYNGVEYEGISSEFKFNFTSIPNRAFNESYKTGYLHKVDSNGKLYSTGEKFNLMDYDMFVLGFYDSYSWVSDSRYEDISEEAVNGTNGVKEFIDSGKSVLFAHDTTSFVTIKDWKDTYVVKLDGSSTGKKVYKDSPYDCSAWGYTLNKNIRDMVGMDAYGISLSEKDGVDYSKISTGVGLSSSDSLMTSLTNTINSDGFYEIGLKALAYKPGSNRTQTVGNTQGLAYGWMDTWNWDNNYYRVKEESYKTITRAERVNEGQITTYPYYLSETINTASTHTQYWSLDLNADDDNDNETDLVVWYTIAGNSVYDKSPRDVLNNYYIYNKGNITYTGIGHSASSIVLEEGKLFINTIVAAYNAGTKEPQVTIYESEDNMTPTTTFYQYGDEDNEVSFRENSQRMYFTISDTNIIRGTKSASANYYVALKAGANVPSGYSVFTDSSGVSYVKVELDTYTKSGTKADANNLQCGEVYYVDVPTDIFDISGVSGQNVNVFMVEAKTTLKKIGALTGVETIVETSSTYHKIEYIRVELFPLD